MALSFTKMHGLGNNYIYLDLTLGLVPQVDFSDLARRVSDVNFGIGSDGLILILPGDRSDFTMRMFNADGSEAEMCGNGIRCVGKYVFDRNLTRKTRITVKTGAGVRTLDLEVKDDRVQRARVDMGEPGLTRAEIPMAGNPAEQVIRRPLEVAGERFDITAVSIGNPHCVIFTESLEDHLVREIGPQIERHPAFPQKTNVEFVRVTDDGSLIMRVWERGSGETMACGTGACAVGVAASLNDLAKETVTVHLTGGDLDIEWSPGNSVFMTGPAAEICTGELTDAWLSTDRRSYDAPGRR